MRHTLRIITIPRVPTLHSLCLANGGQLMRPINLDALPVSLRLLGEETLMTYVPVVEQVAFLQLQEHRG